MGRKKSKRCYFICERCGKKKQGTSLLAALKRKYCSLACKGKAYAKQVPVECAACFKTFLTYEGRPRRTCSEACLKVFRSAKFKEEFYSFDCKQCGKTIAGFYKPGALKLMRERKYCSNKCKREGRRPTIKTSLCENCGMYFEWDLKRSSSARYRKTGRKFCSLKCNGVFQNKMAQKPLNSREEAKDKKQAFTDDFLLLIKGR